MNTPAKPATIGQYLAVPGLNPDLAARTFSRHTDYRHKIVFTTQKGFVHFDKKDQVLWDAQHPKAAKKRGPKPKHGTGKWKSTFWLEPKSRQCLEAEVQLKTKDSYGEIIDMALKAMFPGYWPVGEDKS